MVRNWTYCKKTKAVVKVVITVTIKPAVEKLKRPRKHVLGAQARMRLRLCYNKP